MGETLSGPAVRPKRVPVTFRISPSRRTWLDDIALTHQTDLSVVVRAALAVAAAHSDEFVKRIEEAR